MVLVSKHNSFPSTPGTLNLLSVVLFNLDITKRAVETLKFYLIAHKENIYVRVLQWELKKS